MIPEHLDEIQPDRNLAHAPSPLIGVVTAVGRPEWDLLRQAGESLAPLQGLERGSRTGVQWVVCLDGMPDELQAAHEAVTTSRVPARIISAGPIGRGPGPARNLALEHLTAPWMVTLDADDMVRSDGIAALLKAIEENPGTAWAAGRCEHVDADGVLIWAGPDDRFPPGRIEVTDTFWHAKLETGVIPFICNATLASTHAVRSVGGWPSRYRHRAEDTALWAVLSTRYPGVWLPQVVYIYRRHSASRTKQPGFRDLDEGLDEIAAMVAAGSTEIHT